MSHTDNIDELLTTLDPVFEVVVQSTRGSTPREAGSWMLISTSARWGTIGGGQLEKIALDSVADMLRRGQSEMVLDIPLGPDIGQCCGGRMALRIALLDETGRGRARLRADAEIAGHPHLFILGAGHTGRALARATVLLPVKTVLIDTREEELLFAPAGVETRLTVLPEFDIRRAPPASAFVILTHDHALDFLICKEALARGDATYVGMIGSKTKRAKFESWLKENDAVVSTDDLHCPMAQTAKGDKRPEVLAAFIAAEVMATLASHGAKCVSDAVSPSGSQRPLVPSRHCATDAPSPSDEALWSLWPT